MGDPNDSILAMLKEKLHECEEYEDETPYVVFHKVWEPETGCSGGDGITHTMLGILPFGKIDHFLDQWVTRIRSESYNEEVINDSSDRCMIPLSHFFNENGDIRENTITFTNTSNSRWSCCSGWNDWGYVIRITDNGNVVFDDSMEPRGIYQDDIDDDVAHTQYSITMDEYEIIDLYNRGLENLGKEFDYWCP